MKTFIKPLTWSCIVLAIVNIIWLVFNSIMYHDMPGTLERPDAYVAWIYMGLLFLFFNTLLIFYTNIHTLKNSKRYFTAGVTLLVLGAVSFITIILHFACLIDIIHDYEGGFGIGSELKIARILQIIHLVFLLFAVVYFLYIIKSSDSPALSNTLFREQIFVTLNITGIVCSIAGILIVFLYFHYLNMELNKVRLLRRYDIVPLLFALLPYIFIMTGWVVSYVKDRISGVYDEKQISDINRSGMIALLVSLPLILIIMIYGYLGSPTVSKEFYISGTITILWLPLYIFIVLFVFSASALYTFRNN